MNLNSDKFQRLSIENKITPQDDTQQNYKKFDRLKTGFNLYTEENKNLKYEEDEENDYIEKGAEFVFKHAKEELTMSQNLEKIRDLNPTDFNLNLKYESIISDAKMKEISNDIKTEVNKLNKIINHPTALKPVEDPFGIKRGICKICLDDCSGYSPSHFEFNNFASTCSSCKCGASSHETLQMDSFAFNYFVTSVKNEIIPLLHTPTLSDDDINFQSFLVLFSIDNSEYIDKSEISNFINLLKEGGFIIVQSEIKTISFDPGQDLNDTINGVDMLKNNVNKYYGTNNSITGLLNSGIKNNESINLNKFEMSNIFFKDALKTSAVKKNTTFENIQKIIKVNKNFISNAKSYIKDLINTNKELINEPENENFMKSIQSLKNTNIFNKSKFFSGIFNNIHSNVELKNKYVDEFKKPMLLLCLSSKTSANGIEYFEKFYHAIKNNKNLSNTVIKNLPLVYYSKTRVKALWDLQATFPNLFKINNIIALVIEKPDLFMDAENSNDILQNSFSSFLFNSNVNYSVNKKKSFEETFYLKDKIGTRFKSQIKSEDLKNKENKNFAKNFSEFKDFLITNSINLASLSKYNNISELIQTLNQNTNFKANYINNLINYISHSNGPDGNNKSNSINNSNKCAVAYLNRVGNFNSYNPSGFWDKLDILNFKSLIEQDILSNIFFSKKTSYSRVMIIFRPIIVRNGLLDPILNILRLNNFFILKRKALVLNKFQLHFLYQMEFPGSNIEDNKVALIDFDEYVKMMTDFNIEIVILSKFGALEDSKLLCGSQANSASLSSSEEESDSSDTNIITNVNLIKSLKNVLSHLDLKVEYEIDNDLIHKDERLRYNEKILTSKIPELHTFCDFSSLLNMNKIFSAVLSNKNMSYTKDYRGLLEVKRNVAQFCSLFNIFLYNTKSDETVDQEINFFFPEFGSIQEVLVMLRPSDPSSRLINENVKQIFEKMNFEILDSVMYRINEDEFGNLFDQYFTENLINPFEYSWSKDNFNNFDVEILRMVKAGGIIELSKIIGNDNYQFLKESNINENNFNKLDLIKNNCYFLSLSSQIEYYYPIVNQNISIQEGGYLLKHSEDKYNNVVNKQINNSSSSSLILNVLNSCIKCTVGESIRFDAGKTVKEKLIGRYLKFFHYDDEKKINEYFLSVLDHYMFSKWNISSKMNNFNEIYFEFLNFKKDSINTQVSFFVESNDLGFYEVRIPILDNLFDTLDFNIAKTYLYSDGHFFKELSAKYNLNDIIVEHLPFSLSSESSGSSNKKELDESQWIKTHLDIDVDLDLIHNNEYEALGLNLNIHKIVDNLAIIKKRLFYKTKFECNKLFYMMCSLLCDEDDKVVMAPKNYHYRIKPDDITMDVRRIYETEEFGGLFFIEVVTQDFMKYRLPEYEEKGNKSNSKSNSKLSYSKDYITNKRDDFRYSLPTYLWGRKLAKICEKLEKSNPLSDTVDNCGPLIYSTKDEKLKGIVNPKYFIEYEHYLYINILFDLKLAHESKVDIEFNIFDNDQYSQVENKLLQILNSEIFIKTREKTFLTPSRINENNLRISKGYKRENKGDIEHEIKFHQYFKKNEEEKENNNNNNNNENENENITKDIANKNVVLIDVFCQKGSRYRSYAAFQYLLNIVYKKLSRKSYLINNNEEEYDKMLEALLKGFNNNINFDSAEVNDNAGLNAYKIEYFLYLVSEIKFLLNDLHVSKVKLYSIKESHRVLFNFQKQNLYRNQSPKEFSNLNIQEYEALISTLKKNINELNMNLEIIFFELLNYDFKHKILRENNIDYIILPKERYHIPMYFEENWERNLNNKKYVFKKTLNNNYLMDINIVRTLSNWKSDKNPHPSGNFNSTMNNFSITKNMLREPIKEISKEIVIQKPIDNLRIHPIKAIAELIRKQNNI